jgi:hypothetical protein
MEGLKTFRTIVAGGRRGVEAMKKRRFATAAVVCAILFASGFLGLTRLHAQTNDFASYLAQLKTLGVSVQQAALVSGAAGTVADIVLPAEAEGAVAADSLPYQRMEILRQAALAVKQGLALDAVRIRELDAHGGLTQYLEVPVAASDLPDTSATPQAVRTDTSLEADLENKLAGLPLAGAALAPVSVGPDAEGVRQVVIHLQVKDLALANNALPAFMYGQRSLIDDENQQGAGVVVIRVEADAADGTPLLRYVRDVERREEQCSLANGVDPAVSMASPPVAPGN